ncbi:ABC transporter ATP-binding protein [candidate division FCPU426 bacterium]|nr:ABC transporter ATP-binding protein [candidate division FCPU426 bacterium]
MPQISMAIKNLKKTFGSVEALKGVSLVFESGRLHGLIGPDGAGKTTLLRQLIGLLHPTQGEIIYQADGKPKRFAEVRPGFAYMPQQQSLYADLSVSEHLDFFRDLYQIPKAVYQARRLELLHLTRLEKFQDRPAGKLSGGMYKKLGLMCALLQSPSLVLLDEPTNGVDPISRREFWELLYRLVRKKITVIVSTAYMDEAERCSRVHILEEGRLLASGEPRSILEQVQADNFEAFFLKAGQEVRP